MTGIVDCNSFYCSCERLFRPDLRDAPVVVLSNNDGCIVSRTDEAKALGVDMAVPYYQCRDVMQRHRVAVFSSNYHLYGDMSMRVMDTLRRLLEEEREGGHERVEVYSVDEAFIDMRHIPADALRDFSAHIRAVVECWTGIRVSVGVAPNKLLSKVANKLAKKDKRGSGCVWVLDTEDAVQEALERTPVGDLWGIGHRYAVKLRDHYGIQNARQLRGMPEEWARRHLGGVVGARLIRELRGESCIGMKDPLERKKMIATTRMFGRPVFELAPLREAVATYVARAAEKLRRQGSAAGSIDVFVVTNGDGRGLDYDPASHHRYCLLPRATSLTPELLHHAVPMVEQLWRPGRKYLKAGVILGGLVPDAAIQGNLFMPEPEGRGRALMKAIDGINAGLRDDMVKYAASGLTRDWKMRQELRSPRFTTRWGEMSVVR
jgi:DNA polymerase V